MKVIFVLLALIIGRNSYAQITTASEWTWMKGSNSSNGAAVYGLKGIAAPGNTPGARIGVIKWTDESGNLWLFGGSFGASPKEYYNDLWKYDPSINQWTWVSGDNIPNQAGVYGIQGVANSSNKPEGRLDAVSWMDESGKLWFYGGEGNSYIILNDLWNYDPATNLWTWMKGGNTGSGEYGIYGVKGVFSSANKPGNRRYAVSWTDKNNNLWLFGGWGNSQSDYGGLNDLWEYNIISNQWAWINGDSSSQQNSIYGVKGVASDINNPGARFEAISWTDISGNLWLFSGRYWDKPSGYVNSLPNDLWKYDIGINQWTWMNGEKTGAQSGDFGIQGVPANSNQPPSKFGSSSCTDTDGNFWVFGGANEIYHGAGGYVLNDLWKYNTGTNQWTWMYGHDLEFQGSYGTQGTSSAANKMGSRTRHALWADNAGNLWIFGGILNGGWNNDLWNLSKEPDIIVLNTHATCSNSNGSVTINVNFGTAPYSYSIDGINFQTSNTFTGLPAATYTITVKDAFNSIATTTVTIANESAPSLSGGSTASTCGNANGNITATATGGKAPLQYSINGTTYQGSNIFSGLSANNYTVYVKDANGCITTTPVVINDESAPSLSASTTSSTCTNNDGTITANATGGKPPFLFSINGSTYQPINTFNSLPSGNYTVYVKDANNCVTTSSVTLSSTSFPPVTGISIYPNPTSDNRFTIVLGNQLQGNYSIRILDVTGQLVYRTVISNACICCSGSYSIKPPFLLSVGVYNVEVIDPKNNKSLQRLMIATGR